MLLDEIFESNFGFIEDATEKSFVAELKNISFAKVDWKNGNGRTYPKAILKPAVEALNSKLESGFIAGYPGHSSGEVGAVADISHILRKVHLDEKGLARADIGILNTTRGKDLLKLLKAGLKFGLSMRGYGELDSKMKVKEGYRLKTVDIVEDPSFRDFARLDSTHIFESAIPGEDKKTIISKDEFDAMLEKMMESGHALNENKDLDLDVFKKDSYDLYKKLLAEQLIKDEFFLPWIHSAEKKQTEEDKKLKEDKELRNLYDLEYLPSGGQKSFIAWKEMYQESENRDVEEHEKLYRLYEEYLVAGGDLDFKEWKKKY